MRSWLLGTLGPARGLSKYSISMVAVNSYHPLGELVFTLLCVDQIIGSRGPVVRLATGYSVQTQERNLKGRNFSSEVEESSKIIIKTKGNTKKQAFQSYWRGRGAVGVLPGVSTSVFVGWKEAFLPLSLQTQLAFISWWDCISVLVQAAKTKYC